MKRLICIFIALLMIVSVFTACGDLTSVQSGKVIFEISNTENLENDVILTIINHQTEEEKIVLTRSDGYRIEKILPYNAYMTYRLVEENSNEEYEIKNRWFFIDSNHSEENIVINITNGDIIHETNTDSVDTTTDATIYVEDEVVVPPETSIEVETTERAPVDIEIEEDVVVPETIQEHTVSSDTNIEETNKIPETIHVEETTKVPEADTSIDEETTTFETATDSTSVVADTTVIDETTEEPKMIFKDVRETVWVISKVNIREEPSFEANILGKFSKGDEIYRTGESDEGWSRILLDGKTVYCSSDYVSKTKPESELVYPLTYEDETAKITIYKEWYENAWCYIAHLEFTDYTRFATYCANGKYNNGYQKTSSVAKKLGAIFAVNGCYSAPYLNYGVIRNGVVCNDVKWGYVAGYSSDSGLFGDLVKDKYSGPSLTELAETKVVTDTFCFGPAILVDGKVLENKDTSRAQRTFIGTNGNPGDLWIVVSDGRYNDGESAGLRYVQCAQLLADKGCTYGIPLDGGGSSTMVFQGKILNANGKKERAVVDFAYFK